MAAGNVPPEVTRAYWYFHVRASLVQSPTTCRPDGAINNRVYTRSPLKSVFFFSQSLTFFSNSSTCFVFCIYPSLTSLVELSERSPRYETSSPATTTRHPGARNKSHGSRSRHPPELPLLRRSSSVTHARSSHAGIFPHHPVTYTRSGLFMLRPTHHHTSQISHESFSCSGLTPSSLVSDSTCPI